MQTQDKPPDGPGFEATEREWKRVRAVEDAHSAFHMNPSSATADALEMALTRWRGGDAATSPVIDKPVCANCGRDLNFGRQSGRWFHPETGRFDCLRSEYEDAPMTMAQPSDPKWQAVAETARAAGDGARDE